MEKKSLVRLLRKWVEESGAERLWGRIEKQGRVHFKFTWNAGTHRHPDYFKADFFIDAEVLFDDSFLRDYVVKDMTRRYQEALHERREKRLRKEELERIEWEYDE